MLTIHLAGGDSPFFYDGSITDLFRTVRVIGQAVVFVELSPGHLLNLSEVERIEESDDTPDFKP